MFENVRNEKKLLINKLNKNGISFADTLALVSNKHLK